MLAEEIIEKLKILPLEDLLQHEQTIEPNVKALREAMLNMGRLVDPLIIDNKHNVVLDGNHRRDVLELLQTENAVCQVVDYYDPSIRIGSWYLATLTGSFSKLEGKPIDYEQGMKAVDNFEGSFLHITIKDGKKQCRLIPSKTRDMHFIIDEQEAIMKKLMNGGKADENSGVVQYVEDSRIDYFLEKNYSILARRKYTKDEVVAEAKAKRPLPPKSTRHLIPNRIVRLNFHLGYLNEPVEVGEKFMRDMIKKRVLHGSARYYTEPVIVLY